MDQRSRAVRLFWVLMACAVFSVWLSLTSGDLAWSETPLSTLWEFRGARSVLAFGVGGALAVAGMLLQALFANPLCEPYTLGVSSGAALGAVVSGALGITMLVEGAAVAPLLGALLFAVPLLLGPRGPGLLLLGVLLGFFGSSLVALVMALSDTRGVGQALIWLLGDLTRATSAGAALSVLSGALIMLWVRRRHAELDLLLMGEQEARSVGVPMASLQRELIGVSVVLVAVAVSLSGMIGFVGLMIPHAVRSLQGSSHRWGLPLAWVLGGLSLVLADLLGRLIFSPTEIPIGVVTALVGVPLFGVSGWRRLRAAG